MTDSKTAKDCNLNLPTLPPLRSAPVTDPLKAKTSDEPTGKIEHKMEIEGIDPPKLELITSNRSQSNKLSLARLPALRSLPLPTVPMKQIDQTLGGRVEALSKPNRNNSQHSEQEKSNFPKPLTLRSCVAVWGLNGQARSSLTKTESQKRTRTDNTLLTSCTSRLKGSTADIRKPAASSSEVTPRTTSRQDDSSASAKVKRKTVVKVRESAKRRLLSPRKSEDENITISKPPTPEYIPTLSPLQPAKAKPTTSKDEKQGQSKLSTRRSVPRAKKITGKDSSSAAKEVAQRLFGSGNLPLNIKTNLAVFYKSMIDEKSNHSQGPGKGRTGKLKENSVRKLTKIAKARHDKMSAVERQMKNGPKFRNAFKAENHVKKGSSANKRTQSTLANSKSNTADLPNSDSSDSGASGESDGSYTSASSDEYERNDLRSAMAVVRKSRRIANANSEDKKLKGESGFRDIPRAQEDINHNIGSQDGQSGLKSRKDLVPTKETGSWEESLPSMPSISIIDKTSDGTVAKENHECPNRKQRDIPKRSSQSKSTRKTSKPRSYAEQLLAFGQDISGVGYPIRKESLESDG